MKLSMRSRRVSPRAGLGDMPDAQTTLGIALYSAGKKPEALDAFQKASMATTRRGTRSPILGHCSCQRPAA